jgi:ABC-type amino acid transport substrate-binding protein
MRLERASETRLGALNAIALAISLFCLVLATWLVVSQRKISLAALPGGAVESAMDRIKRTKVLRVGYSGFKPYTIIDLRAGRGERISGFCVDMVNEIASRQTPPWTVEWHKVTFETLKADMDSGRFDVFADAVYQTAPRAAEFGLTAPYSYFGVAAGVVRKSESRFVKFEDLDRPDVTIALAEGWTATEYARGHLKRPKLQVVPVGDDPFIPLQQVISGNADIALQDVPTVLQFVRAHPDEVKALWVSDPPTRVPAGFMTRQNEIELLRFLDASIGILEADGTLESLDKKWRALSEFPAMPYVRGAGLSP